MNLSIDIFGCATEVILLWYFYSKLLGKSKKGKLVDTLVYLAIGIYVFTISSVPLLPQLRTIFVIFPVCLPITLYK